LKIKVLDVPHVVQSGHDVPLTCDYDLERQRLYQVKWYKGTHEFYRYSPTEGQKVKLFLVDNLRVDVSDLLCVPESLHSSMSTQTYIAVAPTKLQQNLAALSECPVITSARSLIRVLTGPKCS
jgi:hypothetical protein